MLEAAAPHLVRLRADDRFTDAILREGWNAHWGIVLRTAPGTDLYAVRQHLRRFLRVIGADGKAMFFRFYDPRAFRSDVRRVVKWWVSQCRSRWSPSQ